MGKWENHNIYTYYFLGQLFLGMVWHYLAYNINFKSTYKFLAMLVFNAQEVFQCL